MSGTDCDYDKVLTGQLVEKINGMAVCVDDGSIPADSSDRALCAYTKRRDALARITFDALHRCKMMNKYNVDVTIATRDKTIDLKLVRLSGVAQGKLLFDSKELAAVGRKVAGGKERAGSTPAYFGHAANLYPEGTIGKGINDSLWVVVAETRDDIDSSEYAPNTIMFDGSGKEDERGTNAGGDKTATESKNTYHRWVEATELEKAKYETLMELDKAIKERRAYVCSLTKNLNKQVAHYGGLYADADDVLGKHLVRAARHAARSPRRRYGANDNKLDFGLMMEDDY